MAWALGISSVWVLNKIPQMDMTLLLIGAVMIIMV